MASVQRLLAALAGIAVAFVFVMVIQALTPDADLQDGQGEVRFDRFAFESEEAAFTEGTTVSLVNAGPVAATFHITDPNDVTTTIPLGPGAARNMTLAIQGTYHVKAEEWGWAEQDWIVRHANPFVRFFEDLF